MGPVYYDQDSEIQINCVSRTKDNYGIVSFLVLSLVSIFFFPPSLPTAL